MRPADFSLSKFLEANLTLGFTDKDQINVIEGLVEAAKVIDLCVRRNGLDDNTFDIGDYIKGINADGDRQKVLDLVAEKLIIDGLQGSTAAMLLSEEKEDPISLNDEGSLIVAIDPLDGSSNIDVNVTIGTIFSILPKVGGVLQKGENQLAAGFFTYGPQTTLILTFAGGGVQCFTLDSKSKEFMGIDGAITIPNTTAEFAINSAYSKHFYPPMIAWMDDTLLGDKDYSMRWVGSLVSDAWRIFQRGGVFLYPANKRKGSENGRLRLVYEANPIAMLTENAGGKATDGTRRILEIIPDSLHQRVPLFFGAKDEVERLEREHLKT